MRPLTKSLVFHPWLDWEGIIRQQYRFLLLILPRSDIHALLQLYDKRMLNSMEKNKGKQSFHFVCWHSSINIYLSLLVSFSYHRGDFAKMEVHMLSDVFTWYYDLCSLTCSVFLRLCFVLWLDLEAMLAGSNLPAAPSRRSQFPTAPTKETWQETNILGGAWCEVERRGGQYEVDKLYRFPPRQAI